MPNTTTSANMNLPLPIVGQETGPQWATDNNNCFTIIDAHDHTNGNGVQITPSGMNINANLSFNSSYSPTNLKSAVFVSQSAALTGTNFISFVGGNLYVNDSSGNQIPITSGGGVAGTPGSIGSLASPAAATYSAGSKLFTWTADSLKAAAMDNGAVTIRETNVASAKGITVASPSALAADYQITLPAALPASTLLTTLSASGNVATVANASIGDTLGAAMTATGANAIAATRTRATGTTVAAGGVAISASSGTYNMTSGTTAAVTNLSVTITTSGRPVKVMLISDGSGLDCSVQTYLTGSGFFTGANLFFVRDSTSIYAAQLTITPGLNASNPSLAVPSSSFAMVDAVAAGTYIYTFQVNRGSGTGVNVSYTKLCAYEL